MTNPETRLRAFQAENNIFTKGPLSLVIQFTRLVRDQTFPLNPDDFQTSGKGQVAGLGGGNLKKILKEHGITQQLSAEGGRTSRGSMGLMIKYVDFLNAWNTEETLIQLGASPEQARSILPNSLKTEIVVTMNLREWRHFFKLRTSKRAHPQMREISIPLLKKMQDLLPTIFDDIQIEG